MTYEFMIAVLCGYFIGSIPFGWLVARVLGLGDLRNVGSGGTGATNAMRVGGFWVAFSVFALDLAKAFLAVRFFGIWAGIAAIAGHCWPVWLGFRGGKGLSSSAGFVLAACPLVFAFCFPILNSSWILNI